MSRDRPRNYNPADYKAIEQEAKLKSKEDLEAFYVETKDRKYIPLCVAIMLAIIVAVAIVGIGWMIMEMGKMEIQSEVKQSIKEISYEICPIMGDEYVSIGFFESEYKTNKIDCRKFYKDK